MKKRIRHGRKMPKLTKFKLSKKAGMIPGTLVHIGEKKIDQPTIEMFDYTEDTLKEEEYASIEQSNRRMEDRGSITWINVTGLHDTDFISKIGKEFDLHTLVLEDIVNTDHRPKAEEFEHFLFFTLKMLDYDSTEEIVTAEQVSFILGPSTLLSFQEREGDVFGPIRERLRDKKGRVRQNNSDYLLYALLDVVIDQYYRIMEAVSDKLEELEEIVLHDQSPEVLKEIQHLKMQLMTLRKAVFPLREALNSIIRGESKFVQPELEKFYRDLHDHTIAVIETVEIYREQLSSIKDLYLSCLSNKMNNIMKVLTIMASIFIPLTFIAGIYGMNFTNLPETQWEYGYAYFWGLIVLTTVGMIWFFKRKDWL